MHTPKYTGEYKRQELKLIYRNNSLYRSLLGPLTDTLSSLGYHLDVLALDEHIHAKAIRRAIGSVVSTVKPTLVLTDHTCWQAIVNRNEFPQLQFPFGHLDTLASEAAVKTLFPDLEHPEYAQDIQQAVQQTLRAIVELFTLMRKKNPSLQHCHIVQSQLAEHVPFVIPFIYQMMSVGAPDDFPPDRQNPTVKAVCDLMEEAIGTCIQEAIASAGVNSTLHTIIPPANDSTAIVLCDTHYAKTHPRYLPHGRTLTLPLASAIADAIEHNLLPSSLKDELCSNFAATIEERHQKFAKAA